MAVPEVPMSSARLPAGLAPSTRSPAVPIAQFGVAAGATTRQYAWVEPNQILDPDLTEFERAGSSDGV